MMDIALAVGVLLGFYITVGCIAALVVAAREEDGKYED